MLVRDLAVKLSLAQPSVPPIETLPTLELIRMGGFAAVAGYAIVVALIYRLDRNRAEKSRDTEVLATRAFVKEAVAAQLQEVAAKEKLAGAIIKMHELLGELTRVVAELVDEVARLREDRDAKRKGTGG